MSVLKNAFSKIPKLNVGQIMKYSINARESTGSLPFETKITQEESTKVLNTLNESDPIQLSRYKIPQTKIKNIEKWKIKKGPFQSLSDILEVDGFSEKILRNICDNIINENVDDGDRPSKSNKSVTGNKKVKQILIPPINGLADELNSATGVHLSPIGISWARLSRQQNKLTSWNFEDFSSLPKKMLPVDTFNQAINIVRRIPPSDVYIFESNSPLSPNSQTQTTAVSSYAQQLELTSMLLALLNTSINHNVTLQNLDADVVPQKTIENRVFHLKPKIPARLFRTLIGKERVSALSIINELVNNDGEIKLVIPRDPINVEQRLKNSFNFHLPQNKELLGQALLLVVSFMDLFVMKNPVSLNAISGTKSLSRSKEDK